jgi:hypothetical protein
VVSLDLIHILAFAKKNPLLQKLTKGDITTVNFRTMASGFSFASHVVINKMSYLIGKMNINHENDKQSENWLKINKILTMILEKFRAKFR